MLTRAPLLPVFGLTLGLAVSSLVIIEPADGTFWFSTFAPLAYSRWELENADGVAIPGRRPGDCEVRGSYATAWLTIVRSTSGDSLFRQMFLHANPGGRLYALIGLAQTDAHGLEAGIAQARRDGDTVYLWRWNELRGSRIPLKDLAIPDSLRRWGQLLAAPPPVHACRA
jgi:hypothetical protein